MSLIIAIDGPAASGKSSVSRALAQHLDIGWLNSGAFYRALTWWLMENMDEELTPGNVADVISRTGFEVGFRDKVAYIRLDGCDPSPYLSSPGVAANVSKISSMGCVRDRLNMEFRSLADSTDCVVEGRDIGSVVFPDTPFKFYLDARPEERERRRRAEGIEDKIVERDRMDSQRTQAPLIIAPDATVVDTTPLDIAGVVEFILVQLAGRGIAR